MNFDQLFTGHVDAYFDPLESDASLEKRLKAARQALASLRTSTAHPDLIYPQIHLAYSEEVFEVYSANETPATWRIFCYYGPDKKQFTILAITPHP